MTIDETPRGPGRSGETPGMGRSRTTARDLERYAGLFARRTQGMKSSAMRDMMAITARPEVISLAGGLPDTTTFPAEDVAALMARVAADASARALQYGPTEGLDELKACIVARHGRGGHGRRRRGPPDHDRRPAGHRPRLQDARRPGRRDPRRGPDVSGRGADVQRVRGRRGPDRDGRRRHAHRCARGDARPARSRGTDSEVHLHRPDLPQPGGRDDVPRAPATAGPDRRRARTARARGQPVRAAPIRGRAAAAALRAGPRRVRDLPGDVLEDPVAGPPPRLDRGAAAGPRQAQPRQAGRRSLLVDVRAVLRHRVLRPARLARPARAPARALPAPARHDVRRARRAPAGRVPLDTARRRPVRLGDAAGVHRHVGPARPRAAGPRRLRAGPRRVPRRPRRVLDAAELRGRGRGRPARGDPADRQGRPRAGPCSTAR